VLGNGGHKACGKGNCPSAVFGLRLLELPAAVFASHEAADSCRCSRFQIHVSGGLQTSGVTGRRIPPRAGKRNETPRRKAQHSPIWRRLMYKLQNRLAVLPIPSSTDLRMQPLPQSPPCAHPDRHMRYTLPRTVLPECGSVPPSTVESMAYRHDPLLGWRPSENSSVVTASRRSRVRHNNRSFRDRDHAQAKTRPDPLHRPRLHRRPVPLPGRGAALEPPWSRAHRGADPSLPT